MFLHFSGLSLIVHLFIIGGAAVVNAARKVHHISAFQTYQKQGGIVSYQLANRIVSIAILLAVGIYMGFLLFLAISTGIEVGASEPQVVLVKAFGVFMIDFLAQSFFDPNFYLLALSTFLVCSVMLMCLHFFEKKIYKTAFTKFASSIRKMNTKRIVVAFLARNRTLVIPGVALYISLALGVLLGILALTVPILAHAQIVEPGFESEVVAGNFTLATAVAFAPDGRIFVAEKGGTVKVVKNGVVLDEPLITLTDINTFGDRGLIGMAIDPNFSQNGYLYLSYTYENSPGVNIAGSKTGRIVRVTVVGDTASESSKVVLVGSVGGDVDSPSCEDFAITADCIPSDSNSHSVGGLRFGPDGKLYATLGDGADFSTVDPRALRSQNLDSLAGKMLRINTDGTAPSDNPFYTGSSTSNRSKVYAYGFRNMFRFNINPADGKIYGGDVGWSNWEEINNVVAGANYGWPCREGNTSTSYNCAPSAAATAPLYTYAHNESGAGSITGGSFFANGVYPSQYATSLFIGDYAQMWMKRLVLDASGAVVSVQDFIPENVWPVEITTGPDGNIYYLDIATGELIRITHTSGNRRPVVNITANPTSGLTPLSVQFTSAGTSDPDGNSITYAWAFGDGGTATVANPSHIYTANGKYQASLTVRDSLGAETAKSMTITVGNQAPQAVITNPASGSLYRALENVTVNGEGTDPESGTLPASAFSWQVLLHHNTHTHPIYQQTGVKNITFVADDHQDPDVYMEIILTVTDSTGLQSTRSINMYLNNGATGGNLISNPSLEIADSLPNTPKDWVIGWYGEMNPIFRYPAQGLSGNRAAEVEVTSYSSGSAKWYFTPAFVTVGEDYTFSNLYKANVPTVLTAQFGRSNGTYFYQRLETLPAVADPTTTSVTFTIPADAETVTVFHELESVGKLVVDEYSLTLAGGDVTPPTGSITNLSDGEVVSGIIGINVSASDNDALGSIHLEVDGQEVGGVEDSSSPYTLIWDTTEFPNGPHTILAHIHDVSGNSAETAAITVQISNNSAQNLIFNGNFETADGANTPAGWTANSWGTHTAVHTYPVAGRNGGSAAALEITNYGFSDTGDSKWVPRDVAVSPGTQYKFEDYYKATSISDVIGRYTLADGSYHYFGVVKEIPAAPDWTYITNTFVPPSNATHVTFFHLISSEATLIIDDMALYAVATGTPAEINPPAVSFAQPLQDNTVSGVVTLRADATDDTAVAGVYFAINGAPFGAEDFTAPYEVVWDTRAVADGTYVLKATAHDTYGNNNKAEITVTVNNTTPPPQTGNNLILNPNLETTGTGGDPANWKRGGWGTNNRTYTYPAPGQSGNGAKIDITSYTNGDAKWFFDEVTVAAGDQFTFSNRYKSTVTTNVSIRYTKTDGTFQYIGIGNPAATATWATNQYSITVPAGVNKMTIMQILYTAGTLEVDTYSLVKTNGTADTTAPLVAVTAPAQGSTVNGAIDVTVSASDSGSGLASVQILIGNDIVASFGAAGPFTYNWNTAAVSNGVYLIRARATDVAGNVAFGASTTVTVNNVTPPPPPSGNNLVQNPDFEISGTGGNPANWSRGGWGVNDRTFTYPVAGESGSAAKVDITSYASGDAKWYFDPIAVTPGQQYTFSYRYLSDVTTNITIRYTKTDGTFEYVGVGNPTASATWKSGSFTVIPPAGVQAVTIMHILNRTGSLTIDGYSLTTGNTNTFDRGKVTFSFDDGWIEHATIVAPVLSAANMDGTFYVVSDEMVGANSQERMWNPTLDVVGIGGNPANWKRGGWGTNNRTYTYPVPGDAGNAAQVEISGYVSGDAKWYADDVAVFPGANYSVSGKYQANVATEVLVRYTKNDATYQYQYLTSVPATGSAWGVYTETFTPPADVSSFTIFHVIAQNGVLIVDDVSVKQEQLYANSDQVLAIQSQGHEIGSHTLNHSNLTTLSSSQKVDQIVNSKSDLEAAGLTISTIAYPYGAYDDEVKTIAKNAGYTLGRSVDRGFNDLTSDPYALRIQQVARDRSLSEMLAWVDQAAANKTWLIFMFHQISNDQSETLGISQSDFQQIVNHVANANVDVITVSEGAELIP